jgi:hypothetical protein
MRSYNCFFLGRDGKLSEVAFAECADDADAIHWAERLLYRNPEFRQAELWEANRLVCAREPLIKLAS